jgi:phosphoribosylformylglycinamidine cyclo-ligase
MQNSNKDRYLQRGVSATKNEVHKAVSNFDKGLFPTAFCKVTEDHFSGNPDKCSLIHSDGSGTKSILAYLHYKETGDASVFRGISQDSIVMNIDDLLCVGITDNILLSSTINRNSVLCDGPVIQNLIAGNEAFIEKMREYGVSIVNGGGETADMGDVVRTVSVDTCAVASANRADIIHGKIVPGLDIVGLASFGKANYESEENSGIGSNGLTSARHDLLSPYYREKYPEAFAPQTNKELVYCGPYKLEDSMPGSSMSVGQSLLSPTRSYAPVINTLLQENRSAVKGLIHCTGGGQGKCIRFGTETHFIKDSLFTPPPIFQAIQNASNSELKEMYQVFNMGHRMEVYCDPSDTNFIIKKSEAFGIEAKVIGRTEKSKKPGSANHVSIQTQGSSFEYEL